MSEIIGACLSQFHDDENRFELLVAFSDGREVGHVVSRIAAQRIAADFAREFDETPSPQPQMAGWQPIETADKNQERLTLGIFRSGKLEEIHVGGYRHAYNDDEASCWWSDQCDDEIVPTHWMPDFSTAPALHVVGGGDITQELFSALSELLVALVGVEYADDIPSVVTARSVLAKAQAAEMSGWRPMSSAPRDGSHILALLYREATTDMDDRRWPAFSEIREIFFKPYVAFGMQLPWHAGDPFEEPSGIGSEHMGEGVPIAWQTMPSVDLRAALASTEGAEG